MTSLNEFSSVNKNRQKISKEIAPIIEKIQTEFSLVLSQARIIKDKANEVLRFENERVTLERHIKELRRDLQETKTHIATVKAENELALSQQTSSINTLRDQLHSFDRTLSRREEYFSAYDRKLGNVMETLSKHQGYVNERLFIFQQKFKQLTRETLDTAKDVRYQFDSALADNMALKSELSSKLQRTEEKQRVLDLYMSEREEIPKKLHQIYQDLRSCLRQQEFNEFQSWQHSAIQQSLAQAKEMLSTALPPHSQKALSQLQERMADIEMVKCRIGELEGIQNRVEEINLKVDQLERREDNKIAQIRSETEEIEQKIIEVIDKKIETIQEEIENITIAHQETVEQKLQKLKAYLIDLINQSKLQQAQEKPSETSINPIYTQEVLKYMFSAELETARQQRIEAQSHCKQIRNLAQGINGKLSLFSNKITMCRSDIEIFIQGTQRELKKIIDLRKEEESHMEQVGRMLANVVEALLMLTSLTINDEHPHHQKTYSTFHDGIILQVDVGKLAYRRCPVSSVDLKESLLLALIAQVDSLVAGQTIFKWQQYKPSSFFANIRQNITLKAKKNMIRSPSANPASPQRKAKEENEDIFFDLKLQAQEFMRNSSQKPRTPNSSTLLTAQNPKSEMQVRYKMKKMEEKAKKEQAQRHCFTTSRSHRKTKITFN